MATKLAIPDIKLELPNPGPVDSSDPAAQESRKQLAKAIQEFSKDALESNTKNLAKSLGFIDESFSWLRIAYGWMVALGLLSLAAAVVKGLIADTGSEAAAAGVLGGASVGLLVGALVLKPTESMERNAIFVPWMLLTLNTYWTRLVYMSDPKTIDKLLDDAGKDAAEQFKAIADAHAAALKTENERLVTLAAPPSGSGTGSASGTGGDQAGQQSGNGTTGDQGSGDGGGTGGT